MILNSCTSRSATFWVIQNNHDAAPTKFWIGCKLTHGSALDPQKFSLSHFEPSLKIDIPGLSNWQQWFLLLRVSCWPIQNLVGAALWFFEMTQKVVPLLFQSRICLWRRTLLILVTVSEVLFPWCLAVCTSIKNKSHNI